MSSFRGKADLMEMKVEVGDGWNVGRCFDQNRHKRRRKGTRGKRKHDHYRWTLPGSNTVRLHARHIYATPALNEIEQMDWWSHSLCP